MKKCKLIICLSILTIVGGFVVFYANNLLMSVICNGSVISAIALAMIPFFVITLDIIIAIIFCFRLYKNPEEKKNLVKHYSLLLFIFSAVGFVFSYIVGEWIYDSFIAGPFNGYSVVMLAVNLLFAALFGLTRFFIVPKMKGEDVKKEKSKPKYVFFNIVLSLAIYYALNKFGAVLYTPVYAQTRTLYMTWTFYVALLTPIVVMILNGLYFLDVFKGNKKALLITVVSVFAFVIITNAVAIIIGFDNPQYIASVSFAVALERLGSFPFDEIFRPLLSLLMGTNLLIVSLKK